MKICRYVSRASDWTKRKSPTAVNRRIWSTLVCSASYQVRPTAELRSLIFRYCGYGRNACANVPVKLG